MAASSLRVVSMSRTCGIFSRITGSSVSKAAAMQGSAAFLAPLIRTVPSRGLPPRITNLSISLLHLVDESPAHGVKEISVTGRIAGGARLQSDLPPMIRRVKKHVRQHVPHTAGPWFALAVTVFDFVVERSHGRTGRDLRSKLSKIISPRR